MPIIHNGMAEAGSMVGHRLPAQGFDFQPKSEGCFIFHFAPLSVEIAWLA